MSGINLIHSLKKIRSSNIEFVIEPYVRFEGLPGEQKTMFFKDPFGNALEFKSFKQDSEILINNILSSESPSRFSC